jgi:hypothetical protein
VRTEDMESKSQQMGLSRVVVRNLQCCRFEIPSEALCVITWGLAPPWLCRLGVQSVHSATHQFLQR